ncbi:bifunctional oligoribonuclease/PAP phosphatase NrnA [Akkermansiaceae bacterium]|nr:bifunctional oligoribonuclease/PAP phosphatase NrnA [Akkermansiaceae bacterium]
MTDNCTISELGDLFSKHSSFLIISHASPDGDALGSTIALGSVLEKLGKKVYYRNEDEVPQSLKFLPNAGLIQQPEEGMLEIDVVVALDCGTKPRLGENALALAGSTLMVNIDHHKTNTGYGDVNYIDANSPATGQILYQIFKQLGYEITDVARDNLYVAVSTDTGSFRYRGTTEETYAMAADLVSMGLDVSTINENIYDNNPLRKIKLLSQLLNTLQISGDGKIAYWAMTMGMKTELSLLPDDAEDMINHIRSIEGVLVAAHFEELANGFVRVSLRSKTDDVDVSDVAQLFGGGGHARAAGIRYQGTLEEASTAIISAIEKSL